MVSGFSRALVEGADSRCTTHFPSGRCRSIVIGHRAAYTGGIDCGFRPITYEPPIPMRPLRALVASLFLIVGVVLGALNPASVMVDLGLFHVRAGLGVILLCTLLAGVLVGGLAMTVSVVMPLRRGRKADPERSQADARLPVSSASEP
jgi:lipopolysaccharide assembly protein A